MSRIILDRGKQRDFLNRVYKKSGLDWSNIASICSVCERTLRDWRREKFYMKYEAAQILSRETSTSLYQPKEILPDYWSTRKAASIGAKKRYKIYGNPGTPEGRKKGGINSQRKFRENPDYAKKLGIQLRKVIKKPEKSTELAEFVGILMGDGGISNHQVVITFNRETDKGHSIYMRKLIKRLFGIPSSIISNKNRNDKADNIVLSSKNLVDFLLKKGLKVGNKIYNRIDIPNWIRNKKGYKIACVRGLMDTDGSFYSYRHKINDEIYKNFAICFTNHSIPLLKSLYSILKELEFKPSRSKWRVYLYRKKDIETYVNNIGSNNPKHIKKYKIYIKERYGSGYNRAVLKTA